MHRILRFQIAALALILGLAPLTTLGHAAQLTSTAGARASVTGAAPGAGTPLLVLGPGDEVNLRVFGQPDMNGTTYVSDRGTISVPLAGAVHVAGLSPSRAARQVEAALKAGQYLLNPHVTLTIVKSRSQKVSVLGQVRSPGIYSIESNTTLLDLLARAGGETGAGSSTIYILRTEHDGQIQRLAVNLQGLAQTGTTPEAAIFTLKGGDQIYIPPAPMFYVTGQVHAPGTFRLQPDMTVLQAVATAGGITNKGSLSRVVIKRRQPNGRYRVMSASTSQKVHANDIIVVKERIF